MFAEFRRERIGFKDEGSQSEVEREPYLFTS